MLADGVFTDIFRALLQGGPPGAVYALIAMGFVLAYKTSGVFNLAFGAQAYVSAMVYFKLHVLWGWNIAVSVLISVVLLAPALGFVLEWAIFRHLRTAPAVAKLVVTIGLTVALPAIFDILFNFQPQAGKTPEGVVPNGNGVFYDPFGVYAYSRNELVTMGVVVVSIIGLGALFKFSAIGLRMRAVVESPRMTELNGIASDRVSAFSWALSSLFAGMAGVLIAPRFNTMTAVSFFDLVVVAITAAAVARLTNLPRAGLAGLGLGVVIAFFNTFIPKWALNHSWLQPIQSQIAPAVPFLVLFGALVLVPSLRRAKAATDPLAGVDPPQVVPSIVRGDLRQRILENTINWGILIGALLVLWFRGDSTWYFRVHQAIVLGIIFLSITFITGLAGEISLAQGTFAAIGAFATYQLVDRYDMSVLVAAPIGAVIAAVVGALLSLPVRRLNGIWVAIATLAFAYFFDSVMVKLSWVGGNEPIQTVPRPVLGPFDFADQRSFLVLTIISLAIVGLLVVNLQRGTIGRKMRALRGSEVAAQAIGISPGRMRLAAFAVSGFIAGLGGAMLATQQGAVNYASNFSPFSTLFWLVIVVTIGVRTVEGAIVGAAAFMLFDPLILKGALFGWILRSQDRVPDILPLSSKWQLILFGLGTIQFARHPEGALARAKTRQHLRKQQKLERQAAQEQPSEPSEPTPATV